MARKVHLSAQIDERLMRKLKRLHRLLRGLRENDLSRSAVVRILLFLGLRAAEGMLPEKLLVMAEEEGLL